LTQGILIGPLTRKFGTRRLIPYSIVLTGLGLTLIPYTQTNMVWLQMLLVLSCIAIGNGVFQPSSSTYLTRLARDEGYDLGAVMGAQESLGAFARILGPLSGGFVWELTVNGSYPWDYHTPFHLCGVLMLISGLLTLRLPKLAEFDESE
jgi:MFS family permease